MNRENAGKYRTVPVTISGSRYLPPQPYLIEKQMEEFLMEFIAMEEREEHPVLIAAFLHERLVTAPEWLHNCKYKRRPREPFCLL
ncbi:MAG: Fic family protein [Tannerellaceae bacterium]|nr:Fic family protein [Tannerellaceae bacterium]